MRELPEREMWRNGGNLRICVDSCAQHDRKTRGSDLRVLNCRGPRRPLQILFGTLHEIASGGGGVEPGIQVSFMK